MKTDDIEQRLGRWAQWVLTRESGGLGYPRECPYTRLMARGGSGFIPGLDAEAMQIETAVCELKKENAELHQVIHVRYLGTRTLDQMYRVCGCSERTFFRRLAEAKLAIKKLLDTLGSKPV